MSITDEGHYGPKQLNLLKTVWGEGFLSPGGTDEIDEILKGIDVSNKSILDIGCGCGGAAIHLIKSKNIEPIIILYLVNKLSKTEVKNLLSKLGLSIRDILRTGEDEYKNNNLKNEKLSDDKLIEFLIKFPKLLQRPIVVKNNKAVVGRPPENILDVL